MLIEPFAIDIPDSALEDLRHRLLNARLPELLAEDIRAFFRGCR